PRAERPRAAAVADIVATVASSSLGSTITTAIVFVPVLFLPGPLGSLFGDMAVCLVAMVAAGWVYAQFILPSLYHFLWKGRDSVVGHEVLGGRSGSSQRDSPRPAKGTLLCWIDNLYGKLLRFSFRRPRLLWGIAVLTVIGGTLLLISRPVRFTPSGGYDELSLELAFPPGTALDVVALHSEAVGNLLSGLPSFASVFGRAGSETEDSLRRSSTEYRKELVQFRCFLKQAGDISSIYSMVRNYLDREGLFDASLRIEPPQDKIESILGLSSGYTVALKAENPDTLQAERKLIMDELASRLPGASLSWRPALLRPEIRLTLKPDMAASAQLSTLSVGRSLMAYTDGLVAARMERDGRPIDIRVSGKKFGGEALGSLEMLPANEGGKSPVLLGSIARIEQRESEAALARLDRSDVVYIDVLPRSESRQSLSSSLERAVKDLKGLSYVDQSAFVRYQKTLLFTVLLVILLLYLSLAAQFESFSLPLLLLVSIPFSLAGAGPALFVVGAGLDSGSVLGLVVLFGLAVNNVIILYEVGRDKMGEGLQPVSAVYRGARERLRPVLATTATTLLALLPVIVSPLGPSQRSMAAAMFGGVAASTLISLLAFPPLLVPFLFRREASHAA
ncbi:MAG: efflux RND transporter permease subunit, partial [Treponema sp.]|nr:efflux RND transporter permease subunit [Treponema sp.]